MTMVFGWCSVEKGVALGVHLLNILSSSASYSGPLFEPANPKHDAYIDHH